MLMFEASHIKAGIWGGLIAGLVFGLMMAMMGMLPMIAMLVGSESATVGFIVHLVISAIIGTIFAIVLGSEVKSAGSGIVIGLIYGAIWWVLGPLLIMPIWLGMGHQLSVAGVQAALPSLWGHLVYGFILGVAYSFLSPSRKTTDVPHTESPAA